MGVSVDCAWTVKYKLRKTNYRSILYLMRYMIKKNTINL